MATDKKDSQPSNPPVEPIISNPHIEPIVAKPHGTASGMTTIVNTQQPAKKMINV
jgi:hypothetical protein